MAGPELFDKDHFYDFVPSEGGVLGRLEDEAREEDIPIIGPVMGRLLYIMARAMGAKKVLELGTATGYSAIWLGRAIAPKGAVKTVEYDKATAERAKANIAEAGLAKVVTVIQGDAREIIKSLKGPFDLVFIDIEKEHYSGILDAAVKVTRPGGLLALDNTAFRTGGDFLERSFRHPGLETVHLFGLFPGHGPDMDAITLCVRKAR